MKLPVLMNSVFDSCSMPLLREVDIERYIYMYRWAALDALQEADLT